MFKWVEIGIKNNKERYLELSQYLQANKFENEVSFIEVNLEGFPAQLEEAFKKFNSIRIGHGLGLEILNHVSNTVGIVNKVKVADTLIFEHGKWWAYNFANEGFSRLLRKSGEQLDFESDVLIVGAGAAARVAITALFMTGFNSFSVSSLNEQSVREMIKELEKTHLGAKFRYIAKDELILLPGTHGIMVNTTPLAKDNPILEELYYFNFFRSGGLAVDFTIAPVETPLLTGAAEVGANCIYGYQVSAQTDILWAEKISGLSLSCSDYEALLGSKLRQITPAK